MWLQKDAILFLCKLGSILYFTPWMYDKYNLKIYPLRYSMSEMMLHGCYVWEQLGQGSWHRALVGPGEPTIVLHIDLPDCRQFCSVKKQEYPFKDGSWWLLAIWRRREPFRSCRMRNFTEMKSSKLSASLTCLIVCTEILQFFWC